MKFTLIPSNIHTHHYSKTTQMFKQQKGDIAQRVFSFLTLFKRYILTKISVWVGAEENLNGTTQGSFFLPAPIKAQEENVNASGQPRMYN